MIKTIYIILLSFLIIIPGAAQDRKHFVHKRLQELEKIKLIESLNMNEETTLKFFARRNAHKDKMQELNHKLNDKADQIQNMLKENPEKAKLKSSVKEYMDIELKLTKEKADFIHSLSDILNDEQIAKVVVFDKMFKEQIKEIVFRERGKKWKNEKND